MIKITSNADLTTSLAEGNNVMGALPHLCGGVITFNGSNNVLYCEENVKLAAGTLTFNGDNGLIMLGAGKNEYLLNLTVNNNCSAVFGRNIYFNGTLNAIASEERTIFIGDDCLFSFGIWMRTADPHLVYDAASNTRINFSKDILIGDHVWIGQNSMILKGSTIGSGSIIGAMSVIAGKTIHSNSSWAGNPARAIRDNVFWDGSCVHTWTSKQTQFSKQFESEQAVFHSEVTPNADSPESLLPVLHGLNAKERKDTFLSMSYNARSANRFYIPKPPRSRHRLFSR